MNALLKLDATPLTNCPDCATIRKHFARDPQTYRMHCQGCLHCGARLIQKMQRLGQLTAEQRREKCRQALADWLAQGHSEMELRALAKASAWAVAPAPTKTKD